MTIGSLNVGVIFSLFYRKILNTVLRMEMVPEVTIPQVGRKNLRKNSNSSNVLSGPEINHSS